MTAVAAPPPQVALSPPGPGASRVVADGRTLLASWVAAGEGPAAVVARGWTPGRAPGAVRGVGPGDVLLDLDARGGEAVAVFGRRWARTGESLLAATRHRGAWGAPVVLSRQRGAWSPRSGVGAVTARGATVTAWVRQHPLHPYELRVRESGGGVAPRVLLLDRSGTIDAPAIASADDGSLALAWEADGVVRLAARAPDGRWSAPATLASGAQLVALASRPGSGAPLVAWTTFATPRPSSFAASVGPDGSLSGRRRLPALVDRGAAAVGPGGRAVVAWLAFGGRRGRTVLVRALTRAPSGRWRSPATLSRPWRIPSPGARPVAAFASDGRAVVAWGRLGVVQARILRSRGWSPVRDLAGARSSPAIVPGAAGVGRRLVVATVWPAAGGAGRLSARVLR